MVTAVSCVKEIFPDATIRTNRRGPEEDRGDPNPSVVISLDNESSCNSHQGSALSSNNDNVLWSAQQRNLYEKYPKKRRRSMINIRKTLEAFKISLSTAAGKEKQKEEPTTSVTTNSDEDDGEPASCSTDTAVCECRSIRKAATAEEPPNNPEILIATTNEDE